MADDLSRRALLKSTGIFAILGSSMRTTFGQSRPPAGSREIMSAITAYMSQAATTHHAQQRFDPMLPDSQRAPK